MLVYILNREGRPLMPCTPRKARLLLKEGKAKVVKRTPFTLQLKYGSTNYTQPITLGVDTGYKHVGLSAVTEEKEVFAAEVLIRDDMVKLLADKRMYRRNRRNRKTRYRKARFLNRVSSKKKGWLAPSIQHKLDTHVKLVERVKRFLPITKVVVEVAAFDIQKIKNPSIESKEYQQGEQAGFSNVREYVLYRDGHKCQNCKGKSKDPILNVHHIVSRKTGGNRPANLITLCKTCHDGLHLKKIDFKPKATNGFRAESFMSMVRWRIVNGISTLVNTEVTYGYITKSKRFELSLDKSHVNDAFVIAGGNGQKRLGINYLVKQVRKQTRKLFRGIRSHLRNKAARFVNGFQRYDKVELDEKIGFIKGRRVRGYFDVRTLGGEVLNKDVKSTKLKLLESFKTLLWDAAEA